MESVFDSNQKNLAKSAGALLENTIAEHGGQPLLILVSAGSALQVLADVTVPENTSHITLGVLDERFTKDVAENNFLLLTQTSFYRDIVQRGGHTIDTSKYFERVEDLAEMMDNSWRTWIEKNPDGHVVATFGMGADGHTAGIMPYAEDAGMFEILFEDERRFAVGYDARGKNAIPLRATATLPFLRAHIDVGIGYVTGVEKKSVLERLLGEHGTDAETPSRIFRDIQNFTLFTTIAS
ncbi:MAG: 6-phosphogluconolactonase [Patescibacteria group bacterium]